LNKAKPVQLKVDWATHEAALFACENWHYSRCIPKSKLVKLGVWENSAFIGVVIFGVGATAALVKRYGLKMEEGCELVRVALTKHSTPVTRIISISLKFLKKSNPGLRLVVSFADPEQGHSGGIYQGGGWVYTGKTHPDRMYFFKGEKLHPRTASLLIKAGKITRKQIEKHRMPNDGKHRYLMPLDDEMRKKIEPLRKPYPKRAPEAEASMRSSSTREIDGSSPISALHLTEKKSANGS
jgi:hypothetical protein